MVIVFSAILLIALTLKSYFSVDNALESQDHRRINHIKMVGIDVCKQQPSGTIPLYVASRKGDIETIRELLRYGCDVNALDTESGSYPLIIASMNGEKEVVALLLDKGAKINVKEEESGGTALIAAASLGRTDVVKLLLDRGADARARDSMNHTALDYLSSVARLPSRKNDTRLQETIGVLNEAFYKK